MLIKKVLLIHLTIVMANFSNIASADDWGYEIEPYLMGSNIEGTASVGRVNGAAVEVDFNAILESLHMGAMLHFEALHESGLGVVLDYAFVDLRDDINGPRNGVADIRVRQAVFQADIFYRIPFKGGEMDYIAGVRRWDNNIEVQIDLAKLPGAPEADLEQDWVDIVMGARWQKSINDQWTFVLRGDVGGFGLESDFTSMIIVGAKYKLNTKVQIDLTYKGLWVDYETGNIGERGHFEYDTVTHGPIIGLIYQF